MILCDSGVRPGCRWQLHRKNRANGAEALGGGVYFWASRRQLTPVNFPKIKKAIRSEFD